MQYTRCDEKTERAHLETVFALLSLRETESVLYKKQRTYVNYAPRLDMKIFY